LFEFADMQSGGIPVRDEAGQLIIGEDTGLVFVLIPGGDFLMGAVRSAEALEEERVNIDPFAEPDEKPITRVHLDPFLISKFEVTQAQWERQMRSAPSQYGPLIETGRRHPVTNVNFDDVSTFTFQLGLDLPTEAQWEYTARAGTQSPWWTGDERASLEGYANLADRGYVKKILGRPGAEDWDDGHTLHAPIGTFPANRFGLHDVAGNVWEWCLDFYGSYETTPLPGTGLREVSDPTTRVMRGGGWDNDALWQRSALRHKVPPEARWSGLGLRPVKNLALEEGGTRDVQWPAPPDEAVESIGSSTDQAN
jgi:formylglycine-generating enzyme required for sulfatase activity